MRSIARTYGQNESQLARVNGVTCPEDLRSGDRLFIPGAKAPKKVVSVSPPVKKSATAATTRDNSKKRAQTPRSTVRQPEKVKSASQAKLQPVKPPVQPQPGRFQWPLRGELLRRFGDSQPFPCKGVEIAAPVGTPVLAAAAGRVIYSDDGIRSFGKMVILKHDDDFFTVYAFNRSILVTAGTYVGKGDKIALSGTPPTQDRSRLYFEIRHRKEPVDPTFFLP